MGLGLALWPQPDTGLGPIAQIMFRFRPGSNNGNQMLYRIFQAFLAHSSSAEKKMFIVALILCS
jgi:hypothetical protein